MEKFSDRPGPEGVDPLMWSNLMGELDRVQDRIRLKELPRTAPVEIELPIETIVLLLWMAARAPYHDDPNALTGPHDFSIDLPLDREDLVDLRSELDPVVSRWTDRTFGEILAGRHELLRPRFSAEDFEARPDTDQPLSDETGRKPIDDIPF